MKLLKNLLKDQAGMTGLETAVILIAFVIVAAANSNWCPGAYECRELIQLFNQVLC